MKRKPNIPIITRVTPEFAAMTISQAVESHLCQGDHILANGDGVVIAPAFTGTVETLEQANGTSKIGIKRDDGIKGERDPNGLWVIRQTPFFGEGILVKKLYDPVPISREGFKAGDLIVGFNGEEDMIYFLVSVGKEVCSLSELGDTNLNYCGNTQSVLLSELQNYQKIGNLWGELYCFYDGCIEKGHTHYEGRGFMCSKHTPTPTQSWKICQKCGANTSYIHPTAGHKNEGICEVCHQEFSALSNLTASTSILPYGYKPRPKFTFTPQDIKEKMVPLYLGVELEVEANGEHSTGQVSYAIQTRFEGNRPWFYVKADGSLENGLEIVTIPATLTVHSEKFPWKELLEYLKANGCGSDEYTSTGFHIHINRSYLSKEEQIKLGYFLATHQHEYETVAHRNSNSYARVDKDPSKKYGPYFMEVGARHVAVNWTNQKTIELRLFKGTLRHGQLLSYLQFVHAVVHFVKKDYTTPEVLQNYGEAWSKFQDYVLGKKKYQQLVKAANLIFKKK